MTSALDSPAMGQAIVLTTAESSFPPAINKLSVIVPCYNEAKTIDIILRRILAVDLPKGIVLELIIVDDCSTDGSGAKIAAFVQTHFSSGIKHIKHTANSGKGAAVKSGLGLATGDYVLIQDADLEYTPADYVRLIDPVLSGYADVVYGSRFMGGGPHRVLFYWHTLGNKILTFINNVLTNTHLTDAHTCYKLVRRDLLLCLGLTENRFAIDAEFNAKIAKTRGLRVYEVGISYFGRTFSDGKKIRFRDALRTVYCLLRCSITIKRKAVPAEYYSATQLS